MGAGVRTLELNCMKSGRTTGVGVVGVVESVVKLLRKVLY